MGSANAKHLQDFRKLNPRIDYYPVPEALAAIRKLQAKYPNFSLRELVDALVIKGCKSCFPESHNGKVTGG